MPRSTKPSSEPFVMPRELRAALPGGHVAPKLVGLAAGVARADDGDLHHLLLEERDAERALEDRGQEGCGIVGASSPLRRRRYGWTMPPWIGPGRTIATSITRS